MPVFGSVQIIRISAPATRSLHARLPKRSKKPASASSTSSGFSGKTREKIDEDMVQVGIVVANDLQCVQNVIH
jgi:tRNA U34 5-carboxymethylaminomethyl modifying GTPase MnmE/TrmE